MLLPAIAPSGALGEARFTYELCDPALPGGATPNAQFAITPGAPIMYINTCAKPDGIIGLYQWGRIGRNKPTSASLTIDVPETPGGFVEMETISGAAGLFGRDGQGSFVYQQGWPENNVPETSRTFFLRRERASDGTNSGRFSIVLDCDGDEEGNDCAEGPAVWAHYIAATEVDPNPPSMSDLRGSLFAAGTIRGHQSLAVEAHDEGGGLSKISVLANGLPVPQPAPAGCSISSVANKSYTGVVALSPTPCPTSLKSQLTVDTQAKPFRDGDNVVQVCASDFATLGSPNTTCLPPQVIHVDNSCANSSVAGGESLSARFSKSNRETLTVGFDKQANVIGQLKTNAGEPVAGATLCVKSQTIGVNPRATNVATLQTNASGHYAYAVPPGPNRQLTIGYRHDTSQIARDVHYYAHARPSLKLTPAAIHNGEQAHLSGGLARPRAARRVVVIQASAPGSSRWITFRKATTNAKGSFSTTYRFTSTTRRTRYRFRALVPRQDGYPWLEGHSKPVEVLVTPTPRSR